MARLIIIFIVGIADAQASNFFNETKNTNKLAIADLYDALDFMLGAFALGLAAGALLRVARLALRVTR